MDAVSPPPDAAALKELESDPESECDYEGLLHDTKCLVCHKRWWCSDYPEKDKKKYCTWSHLEAPKIDPREDYGRMLVHNAAAAGSEPASAPQLIPKTISV